MSTFYYIYPFGEFADDLTAIPSNVAGDGSVSYHDGWTDPYEYDLNTNPAALPVPRGQMNQLFFDITNNIQEYQQYGSPNWITALDNGGVSFPYPQYARVYYSGQVYENLVASNTATPGADDTWLKLSGNAQGIQPGMLVDSASYATPSGGYLYCDGTAYSRTTYATLLAAIVSTQTCVVTGSSAVVTGLSNTAILYAGMKLEGTNIPAGTTILTIDSSSQITMSAAATGSGTSITFYPWGNGDGSTTFNVPDLRRYGRMTSGGSATAVLGNALGQKGGTETNSLTPSNLPTTPFTMNITVTNIANVTQGGSGANASALISPATPTPATVSIPGGGTAVNNVQPTAIVYTFIKT